MRLRNNPNAKQMLEQHPTYVILEPHFYKNRFATLFNNDNPIHIEIGMGKGDFIINMAKQNPTINYIGIEKYDSVLVVALSKLLEQEHISNLKLICLDIAYVMEVFAENEIDQLYLNFSDPWPKKRHAKRRLTHEKYLSMYQEILSENGKIIFKTDHRSLFEFSLISMNQYNMSFLDICLDLHHSDGYEDNIETEYEKKFSKNGPIYRLEAQFIKWKGC